MHIKLKKPIQSTDHIIMQDRTATFITRYMQPILYWTIRRLLKEKY